MAYVINDSCVMCGACAGAVSYTHLVSVSEHAVSACEFAGGGGNKRRNEDRKLSVSVLDVFYCPLHDILSRTLPKPRSKRTP